jgi:hypothetical protein
MAMSLLAPSHHLSHGLGLLGFVLLKEACAVVILKNKVAALQNLAGNEGLRLALHAGLSP